VERGSLGRDTRLYGRRRIWRLPLPLGLLGERSQALRITCELDRQRWIINWEVIRGHMWTERFNMPTPPSLGYQLYGR
jgi:hypothetical protein